MSSLSSLGGEELRSQFSRLSRTLSSASLALGCGLLGLSGFVSQVDAKQPPQDIPTYSNVSVHDPSVIKAGDRYYVFGSHGASAWSEDLLNWTQVASTVNAGNPPHFDTFQSELSELIDWTAAGTLWAADVIQLEDGRFYYYYNVWTDYEGYRSYMGLAVADEIEGPYTDLGEIMRAGTGVPGFNPSVDPNTIDPALFYDEEGRLWMTYGSYSGGIYILEMDPVSGMPLDGQGWGTFLMGGDHARMEGPFIEYNPETGYYYLFLSFGGLGAADGYNMRVFRSENPDGPYYDPQGTNMTEAEVEWDFSTIEPHGLKLAGNWQFLPEEGELAESTGYLSPGHNSVIRDPDTGNWYNIFHTRFVGRGEAHEVRVHELYFNEEGWPVMAPHRYAGEETAHERRSDVPGDYKLILHEKEISGAVSPSLLITLQPNGKVTGEASGKWKRRPGDRIEIELEGERYLGVFSTEWDDEQAAWVYCFSAHSDQGVSIWGSKTVVSERPTEYQLLQERSALFGYDFSFQLPQPKGNPHSVYSYTLEEGPTGMSVDRATGYVNWRPTLTDAGQVYTVTVRVMNTAPDNPIEYLYTFDLATYAPTTVERVSLDFDSEAAGGLLDVDGAATGFTHRLPGTGGDLPELDPLVELDTSAGALKVQTTTSDFFGGAGLAGASMPGVSLAGLGFGGEGDFAISVSFLPLVGLELIDQVGLYVGTSKDALTRAGTIVFAAPEYFATHSQNAVDHSGRFAGFGLDVSDGMDVTIARENGQWGYAVDGVSWAPTTQPGFLEGEADLYAGVFGITPLNGNSKTIGVDAFSVVLATDQPWLSAFEQWRVIHFAQLEATGIAANGADPDKDKRTNEQEFEDGTDPLLAD
ncbi:family 43 glycosylhydrolase [Pelagicoccus sp. SDUM812003]|uniref:family 43 glycosylhydrolase n=1 Tax=Pelagicoccus sp. SDUM812003 TaxID=3041267 RepID=UPI00281059F6|nr:family 43 glycosylhydrolase [Pelagicoccus sp. SDUM812003]MDQ8205519.1 family 43 glycosylhydrolase [Pelagicoccus sp. SDUM812003]